MGNCQAIDAATMVIQHPTGKEDKLYWPVTANEIMKSNPNHYVALLITSTLCPSGDGYGDGKGSGGNNQKKNKKSGDGLVRVTRVKVLRPTETLVLGQVYRLITTQEVMNGLKAKKQAKMRRRNQSESAGSGGGNAKEEVMGPDEAKTDQPIKPEKKGSKSGTSTTNSTPAARARSWQPSLQSISEAGG